MLGVSVVLRECGCVIGEMGAAAFRGLQHRQWHREQGDRGARLVIAAHQHPTTCGACPQPAKGWRQSSSSLFLSVLFPSQKNTDESTCMSIEIACTCEPDART